MNTAFTPVELSEISSEILNLMRDRQGKQEFDFDFNEFVIAGSYCYDEEGYTERGMFIRTNEYYSVVAYAYNEAGEEIEITDEINKHLN